MTQTSDSYLLNDLLELAANKFREGDSSALILSEKQREALSLLHESDSKFILYGGGAGGGKSWVACEWLLWSCIAYPETTWFIGREELKRLRNTTLLTFYKVCKKYHLIRADNRKDSGWHYYFQGQDMYIEFFNGSRIELLDLQYKPRDPMFERFGSSEYTGGFIEEAGEVEFGAFDVLKSRIGRQANDKYDIQPKVLITCNPKKNWLYRKFYIPWTQGELRPPYAFIRSLYSDNPFRESSYEENLEQLEDKSLKARLKDGSWEYDDNPMRIIDDRAIQNLFSNTFAKNGEMYITADVARYGSDFFVIYVWNGWEVVHIHVMEKCNLKHAYNIIESFRQRFSVVGTNVLCDEEGVGGGVIDFSSGYRGFISNSRAEDGENYQYLGDQCGFHIAKRINKNEIYFSAELSEKYKEMLNADLESVERMPRNENEKLRLIRKDDMKKNLNGRSPDFWDTLKMRAYFDLNPPVLADPDLWN